MVREPTDEKPRLMCTIEGYVHCVHPTLLAATCLTWPARVCVFSYFCDPFIILKSAEDNVTAFIGADRLDLPTSVSGNPVQLVSKDPPPVQHDELS